MDSVSAQAMGNFIVAAAAALLWWQLQRQVTRIDKLEASLHDLALALARNHYSKSEVETAVERAIQPMREQLTRIERLASGHPAHPTKGFTGPHPVPGG